jgi:hypothetical protein
MDTKDWFLVIGPLVGVIIGALLTTAAKLIELGNSAIRDDRRFLLSKLEILHACVSDFVSLFAQRVTANAVASLSPNDSLAAQRSRAADEAVTGSLARISAMVRLYAPEVFTFWAMVGDLAVEYNDAAGADRAAHTFSQAKGYAGKIGSACALVLSGVESKVEILELLKIHGKSGFSENLSLTFAKFADSFQGADQKIEQLEIIGEAINKRHADLLERLKSDKENKEFS